jgi:uncharacterized lipoprotein YmbA
MMNCPSYLFRVNIILSLLLLVLSGCASTEPSRFYILSSLHGTEAEQVQEESEQGIAIGVGPVKIPAHLNRPQIVTRTSQNELKLAEFDKWAGSFKDVLSKMVSPGFLPRTCRFCSLRNVFLSCHGSVLFRSITRSRLM